MCAAQRKSTRRRQQLKITERDCKYYASGDPLAVLVEPNREVRSLKKLDLASIHPYSVAAFELPISSTPNVVMGTMQLISNNIPSKMFPSTAPIRPHVTVKDTASALKQNFIFYWSVQ